MLMQSKITVRVSDYTSISQFNHGGGAAVDVINGTRSAYTANRFTPLPLSATVDAVGIGFDGMP